MKQVIQVLEQAIVVLERDGWHQGSFGYAESPKCVAGAIHYAAMELKASMGTAEYARGYLWKTIGPLPLGSWNDVHGRTYEDVISALKQTIVQLST